MTTATTTMWWRPRERVEERNKSVADDDNVTTEIRLTLSFLYYFVRLVRVAHSNGDNGMSSCAEVVATNSCWQTGSTTVRPATQFIVTVAVVKCLSTDQHTEIDYKTAKMKCEIDCFCSTTTVLHVTTNNRQKQQHTETTPLSHIERMSWVSGVHRRHNKHRPIHTA